MDDNRKERFMEAIQSAHSSSLLVYSREKKSRDLASKLHAEVGKMYIAGDLNQAFLLIEKHNSNPDTPGIDCVLADSDNSTLRLLESINKRFVNADTKHLPIISTILLLPKDDPDYLQSVQSVGGANSVLDGSKPVGLIFEEVIEKMYRQKSIEIAYNQLKGGQRRSYPYVPLFQTEIQKETAEKEADGDDLFTSAESLQGTLSDWTHSSSMLPGFIKDARDGVEAEEGKLDETTGWRDSPDRLYRHELDAKVSKIIQKKQSTKQRNSVMKPSSKLNKKIFYDVDDAKSPGAYFMTQSILDVYKRPKYIKPKKGSMSMPFDPELRPFLNRLKGENIVYSNELVHTIGGLSKIKAEVCWDVLSAKRHGTLIKAGQNSIEQGSPDRDMANARRLSPLKHSLDSFGHIETSISIGEADKRGWRCTKSYLLNALLFHEIIALVCFQN